MAKQQFDRNRSPLLSHYWAGDRSLYTVSEFATAEVAECLWQGGSCTVMMNETSGTVSSKDRKVNVTTALPSSEPLSRSDGGMALHSSLLRRPIGPSTGKGAADGRLRSSHALVTGLGGANVIGEVGLSTRQFNSAGRSGASAALRPARVPHRAPEAVASREANKAGPARFTVQGPLKRQLLGRLPTRR
jgi:hypothetical protein